MFDIAQKLFFQGYQGNSACENVSETLALFSFIIIESITKFASGFPKVGSFITDFTLNKKVTFSELKF